MAKRTNKQLINSLWSLQHKQTRGTLRMGSTAMYCRTRASSEQCWAGLGWAGLGWAHPRSTSSAAPHHGGGCCQDRGRDRLVHCLPPVPAGQSFLQQPTQKPSRSNFVRIIMTLSSLTRTNDERGRENVNVNLAY